MKTVGQMLQAARLSQKLELEQAAKVTRIRIDFLRLLESDNYRGLPNATIAKGFIKNYGQFLGENPDQLMAIFRRDFIENRFGQIVPRSFVDPVSQSSMWTPRSTVIAAVVSIFTMFAVYLGFQFWQYLGPPQLLVIVPAGDLSTTHSTVEIIGRTDPEAAVSINGNLISLDKGGEFSIRMPLKPGDNNFRIISVGKNSKTTEIERRVTLTEPQNSD